MCFTYATNPVGVLIFLFFFLFPPTHPLHECSRWHCPKVCWPHGMCRPSHRRYNWWRAPGPGWSAAAWPYWRPPRIPSPLGLKEEGWRKKKGNKIKEETKFENVCKKNRKDINGKRKKKMENNMFLLALVLTAHFSGFYQSIYSI